MERNTLTKVAVALRILYPLWAVIGGFSILFISSHFIVADDISQTIDNIKSEETLYRLGIAGSLVTQLLFLIIGLLLYKLFSNASKSAGILMMVFVVASVPIAMISSLFQIGAVLSLDNPELAKILLNLNEQGIYVASIFWGLWLYPLGYMVYKSNYMHKLAGIFLYIGGSGYLLNSFVQIIAPDLELLLSITDAMTFGEIIFLLWLIIAGVKIKQ